MRKHFVTRLQLKLLKTFLFKAIKKNTKWNQQERLFSEKSTFHDFISKTFHAIRVIINLIVRVRIRFYWSVLSGFKNTHCTRNLLQTRNSLICIVNTFFWEWIRLETFEDRPSNLWVTCIEFQIKIGWFNLLNKIFRHVED